MAENRENPQLDGENCVAETLGAGDHGKTETLYIQFANNGAIRKWSREPFDGGEVVEAVSVGVAIERVLGLPRVRLAELLYEHEGFVDHAHDNHAPDRDVPAWIEAEIAGNVHSGDCTKQSWSCMRCHADDALAQWDEFAAMIHRAQRSGGKHDHR